MVKIDKDSVKKIVNGAVLLISAIGAFSDVIVKDKKDKEFEAMKKAIEELQKRGS